MLLFFFTPKRYPGQKEKAFDFIEVEKGGMSWRECDLINKLVHLKGRSAEHKKWFCLLGCWWNEVISRWKRIKCRLADRALFIKLAIRRVNIFCAKRAVSTQIEINDSSGFNHHNLIIHHDKACRDERLSFSFDIIDWIMQAHKCRSSKCVLSDWFSFWMALNYKIPWRWNVFLVPLSRFVLSQCWTNVACGDAGMFSQRNVFSQFSLNISRVRLQNYRQSLRRGTA